ncbi:MAG: class I SAM-dependent methyltransferase, partial [Candidatus Eisenbacteria bacterium]|nr:class I SAM-dependent methyltransferase [Candidatus Eisenbacteria bacterium]
SYTGLDLDEGLLRVARQQALEAGLQERVEFRRGDARHIELPNGTFDLVLALGGCLTYMGRPEGLERIRQLLAPRGSILISDLVTLDSPVPGEIDEALEALAPNSPTRGLALEPAVRDVYEEGLYRFENESSYRSLFSLFGYDLRFDFLVPESAWNAYYRHAARVLTDPTAEPRVPVAVDELAAFYSWGGRWGLGYLVAGASLAATSEA